MLASEDRQILCTQQRVRQNEKPCCSSILQGLFANIYVLPALVIGLGIRIWPALFTGRQLKLNESGKHKVPNFK